MPPARKVRRIDFSPDEWIAGTVGLTEAEEGLYIRICARIYSRGGPIPIAQLHRPGLHGNTLNSLVQKLVSLGKILRIGDKIDQERCEKELKNAANRIETASKSGRKGNEIRWHGKENNEVAIAPRVGAAIANHQPSDSYVSKDTPESPPLDLFPPNPEKPHVRRGTRLPTDWHPDAEDRAYAQKCGLDADAVAERFADYWHAKAGAGATKLDWHATFRTWCRNEPGHQRHRGREPGSGGNRQEPPSWSAALRRAFPDIS